MSNPNEEKPYEKLKKLEYALEVAKNSTSPSEIFQSLLKLGNLCYEIKANELGLKYVQEAIELDEKGSNYQDIHEFYKLIGDFNFELGYLDVALKAYQISLQKSPKKAPFKILGEINFKMGRITYLQDNLKQAIKHFKKAEKIYKEHELYIEQIKLLNQIGLMYANKIPTSDAYGIDEYRTIQVRGISSFGKAKRYFKKAKMILEENNLEETESELYKTIQSNLTSKFKDYK
jgi:tetratricopeptide (TPR) repeat protein